MPNKEKISFYLERELQKYITPEAKRFFLVTWYRYMFPYIPFRTGLLASLVNIPENAVDLQFPPEEAMSLGIQDIETNPENVIHFRAPYATRQNEGDNFNFTRDIHPRACAHWGQVSADLHSEQMIKELKSYIGRSKNK